jgi:hypothetical protein
MHYNATILIYCVHSFWWSLISWIIKWPVYMINYCASFNLINMPTKGCHTTCHGGARRERRYSSYSFMTLALDGSEWSASHPGRALPPRERTPWYLLDRRLGGPQSWSGHRGYRKNPVPLQGTEPGSPGRPVHSQTLHWLSYPGSNMTIRFTYCVCVCVCPS